MDTISININDMVNSMFRIIRLVLTVLFLICLNPAGAEGPFTSVSVDYPQGENRLVINDDNSAFLTYGALPDMITIKKGTFVFNTVVEDLKMRALDEEPKSGPYGLLVFMSSDGSTRQGYFNDRKYIGRLFDRARKNIIGQDFLFDRLIGLIEIPRIFGVVIHDGPPGQPPISLKPISLYSRPSYLSEIAAVIDNHEMLKTAEHGYEELSAMVYDEVNGWYRVKYIIRNIVSMAWLSPREAGKFHALPEMLTDKLTFINAGWDGRLWIDPHDIESFFFPEIPPARHVRVLKSGYFDDELWLQVTAIDPGWCMEQAPKETITGWLPAYSLNGGLNIWFYSRGC